MLWMLLSVLSFFLGVGLTVLTDFHVSACMLVLAAGVFLWRFPFACILLAFFLGVFRVEEWEEQDFLPVVEGWVSFEALIIEEVDPRRDRQWIVVQHPDYGRICISLSPYIFLEYGDQLSVEGWLESAQSQDESYAQYLALQRIHGLMEDPKLERLAEDSWSLRGLLYALKAQIEDRIHYLFFEPEASFLDGLLVGSRRGMSEDLQAAFQKTGILHLVAISGANISLVIAAVFSALAFLSFRRRIHVSLFAVVFFVILVGASAAAVRAGLMGSLSLLGLYAGRRSMAYAGLLWSAVLMVLVNPYTLIYDVGFQLSFAATFGLLTYHPILDGWLPFRGKGGFFREAFLLTLSAQITTLPFLLFHFGRLSFLSPLVNVLVAPFIPLAMFFGALSLLFGKIAALVAQFYLVLIEDIALFFARFSWGEAEFLLGRWGFIVLLLLVFIFPVFFYRSTLARAFFR